MPPPFSERTSEEIDAEVKVLVDTAYEKAKKMLEENRDKLETLAAALIEKESMDGRDVAKLLGEREGTTRSRLSRARQKLRAIMEGENDEQVL